MFIHVDGFGPIVLGKTCRYCTKCEFIIAHQDELESNLAAMFAEMDPAVIGNEYLVLGTVERKTWKKGMEENLAFEEMREHTAEFKHYMKVVYEPAKWVPPDTPESE